MKIPKVYFTARQLALLPQLFQAIGVLLIGFGALSQERWTAISGVVISVITFWLAGQQAGANDANTKALQGAVGALPDAKPGPQSVQAALDLVKAVTGKAPVLIAALCLLPVLLTGCAVETPKAYVKLGDSGYSAYVYGGAGISKTEGK